MAPWKNATKTPRDCKVCGKTFLAFYAVSCSQNCHQKAFRASLDPEAREALKARQKAYHATWRNSPAGLAWRAREKENAKNRRKARKLVTET